jgi:non-ribosomal peptide synthase protein (TIGR01720 family)
LSKLDVSRTVGWFTSFYPVAIDLPTDGDTAKQIVMVKESARKAADTDAAFGAQRYLARDPALATIRPFISFNFLGDAAAPQLSAPFVRASEFREAQVDAVAPRPVPVDCEVLVVDGCLQCRVTYNGGEFREETMQQFLDNWRRALEQVIHFTAQRQSGAATPSDYTFKELSVQQWEELLDDA